MSMPASITPIFGFAGWSGAGKTHLVERLIALFVKRGLSIATLKHAHHDFDADLEGKDSWRHRQAGATQVLINSIHRTVHFQEHAPDRSPSLETLLSRLHPCDLVLVEGFKTASFPKLEIYCADLGKPVLYPQDPHIHGLISEHPISSCPLPFFHRDDIEAVADFILGHLGF